MKSLNIYFEDKEMELLEKVKTKKEMTWHDLIMHSIKLLLTNND